jgi:hypothetical protein
MWVGHLDVDSFMAEVSTVLALSPFPEGLIGLFRPFMIINLI